MGFLVLIALMVAVVLWAASQEEDAVLQLPEKQNSDDDPVGIR